MPIENTSRSNDIPELQIPTVDEQPGRPDKDRLTAGAYQLDPYHSQIVWGVNYVGLTMLKGMFAATGGSLLLDPLDLSKTSVDVTVGMSDLVATGSVFVERLRSETFFDVDRYPTARFVSREIQATSDIAGFMVGELTIKDITRPVRLSVEFIGAGINPIRQNNAVGFSAGGVIKRSEFGLDFGLPLMSDDTRLDIFASFNAGEGEA